MPRSPSSPQITSKGCSRGFILCVLYRALDYVRQRQMLGHTVQFPFCNEEINRWLLAAQGDCTISEQAYQDGLGGTFYDESDTSTYWTQPQQFCTWWKNNVERKNKFLLLQRDAAYDDNDEKQIARAAYCRNAIAISLSIKNNFHRYLPSQGDTNIVQYIIPYPMPAHMTRASPPTLDSTDLLVTSEETTLCMAQITPNAPTISRRADVAAPATPILPRRIKRPYNKKTPQGLSAQFLPAGVTLSSPPLNYHPILPANQFTPMYPSGVHYSRRPAVLSPPTVTVATEEASSDSGTDDDFFCSESNMHHFTDASSSLRENAVAGRKRKAGDRHPFSHDQLMSSSLTSLSQSLAYSTPFMFPSPVSTHSATLSSFAPTSFSSSPTYSPCSYAPSLLPSSYSTPSPCPASVPADLNIQQYYHIEEERTPCTQPPIPCTYIQFDDDQECFSLKMPEDPFMLDFGNDYFSSETKFPYSFKDSYLDLERYSPLDLDIERKELLKSHSITSPGIIGDSAFKPCVSHTISTTSLSEMQHLGSCAPYPDIRDVYSPLIKSEVTRVTTSIPWQETRILTIPLLHSYDRTSETIESLPMRGLHTHSDSDMSRSQIQLSSKMEVSKKLLMFQDPSSPLLMRKFEEDVISMLSQSYSSHQSFHDSDSKVADSIYSANSTNAGAGEMSNEFLSPFSSPDAALCSPSGLDNADYSLLDDGDDCDLLTYFGIKSSRWSTEDSAESSSEDDWVKSKDDS